MTVPQWRQQLTELHAYSPGADRIRQRASCLEKERIASSSRLLQSPMRANKHGGVNDQKKHPKQVEKMRTYVDALTEEQEQRAEVIEAGALGIVP